MEGSSADAHDVHAGHAANLSSPTSSSVQAEPPFAQSQSSSLLALSTGVPMLCCRRQKAMHYVLITVPGSGSCRALDKVRMPRVSYPVDSSSLLK